MPQDSRRSGRVDAKKGVGECKGGQLHAFGPGTGFNTDLVTLRSKRAGSFPGNGEPPKSDWLRGKGPTGKISEKK